MSNERRCAIHPDRSATHQVPAWGPDPDRRWNAKPSRLDVCAECAATKTDETNR
jgi:hypothetical protein